MEMITNVLLYGCLRATLERVRRLRRGMVFFRSKVRPKPMQLDSDIDHMYTMAQRTDMRVPGQYLAKPSMTKQRLSHWRTT